MHLRDARPDDRPALLALNAASVEVLSPLDDARLARLLDQAALCRVAEREGRVLGFVLALREGRAYDSENYRWFEAREPNFLYVDRIVVATGLRAQGVGRAMYADVFAHARREAVPCVTCEFDVEPPNPASARFHAAQGFREVGRQRLRSGKEVSLQRADVPSPGDRSPR